MIIFLLFLQFLLTSLILYKEIFVNKLRYLASGIFFSIYLLLFVLVPIILHCFYGGARSIIAGKDNLILNFEVYIIYNLLGLVLLSTSVFIIYKRRLLKPKFNGVSFYPTLANKTGIIIVLGLFIFIYSTGLSLSELFSISRFGWIETGDYNVILSVLSTYLIALTPVYIYLFFFSKKSKLTKVIFLMCLVSLIVYSIITKDRKSFFYIFSGFLAAKYHKNYCSFSVNKKHLIIGFALFLVFVFSQFIRDFAPRYFLNEDIDFVEEFYLSSSRIIEYSDLSYFYRASVEAIYQNYENDFYIPLGIIRRTLFFYLPANLSGGLKIEDMSAVFSDVVGGGTSSRRGSMPPGFFGIFVLSFGWLFSIFLMPLISYFIHKIDILFIKKITILQIVAITLYFTGVVFVFRGDESTSFYFFISNLVFLKIIISTRIFKNIQ
ncbi:O-antigen polymerase [Chryseobacterium scophthalmum]|uniref:Oligosaccharide repeat unit polymerase n=1 Tax=Chryseobacterium scophthalmum TaxID=59733 RepID=A0A1N6I8Y5_9FLAO|nr:O-antigen polymerase [Chryseobacterium scophthalmum]SIO28481.1 hypothetical protein SAMN05421769_3156 [Chryseobacterium scophthalmum]